MILAVYGSTVIRQENMMEVMMMGRGHGRGWSGWFTILITSIFLRGCYLQYTNFLSLSDKESVMVSAIIPVHVSGKQGEVKAAPELKRHSRSLNLRAALIARMAEICGGFFGENGSDDSVSGWD